MCELRGPRVHGATSIDPDSTNRSAFTREDARRVDALAQSRLGLPGDLLMENAGAEVARVALRLARSKRRRRVVVLCGAGNNGGDGLVAARHLLGSIDVRVLLVGSAAELRGDARKNFDRLAALGSNVEEPKDATEIARALRARPAPVVIDALFGIGLSRPVEGTARAAIDAVNAARCPVVAVDVPSGLDCDTGEALGAAIRATITVTFVRSKIGFARGAGPKHCGSIEVASIGFPAGSLSRGAP